MSDEDTSKSDVNWQTIIVLLAAAGGLFWLPSALRSSRPEHPIIGALLMPAGGAGVLTLLDFLAAR